MVTEGGGGAGQSIAVQISPTQAQVTPAGSVGFSATVSGTANTSVVWSVTESAGGSVNASGVYTAPSSTGTFHVVATSVADSTKSASAVVAVVPPSPIDPTGILSADRATRWVPGLMAVGGIPARATVCATVQASTYGNGSSDATAGINAAISGCPVGQVVQLSAGTFLINNDVVMVNKGITLRGAGADSTLLIRTNGATPGSYQTNASKELIVIGLSRFPYYDSSSYNLSADGQKGSYSVQLASAPAGGFTAGQMVVLDELSGAGWQTDPGGRGQIWASPDFRVVYQRHNPPLGTDDNVAGASFMRSDRPTSEIKEVQSYDAGTRTITFNSPLHIDYRVSHTAQITTYTGGHAFIKNAGVENLKVQGGDHGNIRFHAAAYSWVKGVEVTGWLGEGIAFEHGFRNEIRDSYVHTPVWFEPGGGSYNIAMMFGTSEILIENNISIDADKVMVARSCGAGSVVGYNYMDDGHIGGSPSWVEIGLNGSHQVGPHHMLFEGNYAFNADSDKTHGNSIYHTFFRNHLSGQRRSYTDGGPRRCAGAAFYSYWMSFVGNVLGRPGQMSGWTYESQSMSTPAIWLLGWDDWSPYPADPNIMALTHRHGNFDYLTNSVQWATGYQQTLPNSLYLTGKPAFFNAGSGYEWPWVDPTATPAVKTLPAKARYDAGTPFVQP